MMPPGLCAERNHAEFRRIFHTLCPADKLSFCASQCGQRWRPVAPPHGMPPARTLLWGPAPDPRATCPAPGRRRGQASASAQTRPPRPSRSSITDPAARQAAAAAAPTPSRSPVHARRGHTGPQLPPRLVPPMPGDPKRCQRPLGAHLHEQVEPRTGQGGCTR